MGNPHHSLSFFKIIQNSSPHTMHKPKSQPLISSEHSVSKTTKLSPHDHLIAYHSFGPQITLHFVLIIIIPASDQSLFSNITPLGSLIIINCLNTIDKEFIHSQSLWPENRRPFVTAINTALNSELRLFSISVGHQSPSPSLLLLLLISIIYT